MVFHNAPTWPRRSSLEDDTLVTTEGGVSSHDRPVSPDPDSFPNPMGSLHIPSIKDMETEYLTVQQGFSAYLFQRVHSAVATMDESPASAVALLMAGLGDVQWMLRAIQCDLAGRQITPRLIELLHQYRQLEEPHYAKLRLVLNVTLTDEECRALILDKIQEYDDNQRTLFRHMDNIGVKRLVHRHGRALRQISARTTMNQMREAGLLMTKEQKDTLHQSAGPKIIRTIQEHVTEASQTITEHPHAWADRNALTRAFMRLEKARILFVIGGSAIPDTPQHLLLKQQAEAFQQQALQSTTPTLKHDPDYIPD